MSLQHGWPAKCVSALIKSTLILDAAVGGRFCPYQHGCCPPRSEGSTSHVLWGTELSTWKRFSKALGFQSIPHHVCCEHLGSCCCCKAAAGSSLPAGAASGLWYEQPQSSQIFALQQMLLYILSFPEVFGYYGEAEMPGVAVTTKIRARSAL